MNHDTLDDFRDETVPIESLPGWYWRRYDDGSGFAIGPGGVERFEYDAAPYYGRAIEYKARPDSGWDVFNGGLDLFWPWAEKRLAKTLAQNAGAPAGRASN